MDGSHLKFKFLVVCFIFMYTSFCTAYFCGSQSKFSAEEHSQSASTKFLSGKLTCSWNFYPSRRLEDDEYLEITWDTFNVNSEMPSCHNEYVEVLLTKKYHSLGKICSKNSRMDVPFRMYSVDGYARIRFKLNSNKGGEIALEYRIRGKPYYSKGCGSAFIGSFQHSGSLRSPGWPETKNYESCNYDIYSDPDTATKIFFMNFDLAKERICGTKSPYVEIRGSHKTKSFLEKNLIRRKMCGYWRPFTVTSAYERIEIRYQRGWGLEPKRGFVAGVIKYAKKKSADSSSTGLVIGIVVGILALLVVIAIIYCAIKRVCWRKPDRPENTHLTGQGALALSAPQAGTHQPMYPVAHQTYAPLPVATPYVPPASSDLPPTYSQATASFPPQQYVPPPGMPEEPGAVQPPYAPSTVGPYPPSTAVPYPPSTAVPYPPSTTGPYPPSTAGPYPGTAPGPYPPMTTTPYPPTSMGPQAPYPTKSESYPTSAAPYPAADAPPYQSGQSDVQPCPSVVQPAASMAEAPPGNASAPPC